MPKIPTLDEPLSLSTTTPGVDVNPGQFGGPQRVLGGLSKEITELSLDFANRQKQLKDRNEASERAKNLKLEIQSFTMDAQSKAKPNGNIDDNGVDVPMNEYIKNHINARYEEEQSSSSTETARQMLVGSLDDDLVRESIRADDYYANSLVTFRNKNEEDILGNEAAIQATRPDAEEAFTSQKEFENRMDNDGIIRGESTVVREEQKEKFGEKRADNYFQAALNSNQREIQAAALNRLKVSGQKAKEAKKTGKKPGKADITDYLSDSKKVHFAGALIDAIKRNDENDKSEVNLRIKDNIDSWMMNGPPTQEKINELEKEAIRVNKDDADKARAIAKINVSASLSQDISSKALRSPDQYQIGIPEIKGILEKTRKSLSEKYPGIKSLKEKEFGASMLSDAIEDSQRLTKKLIEERKDPSQFVRDHLNVRSDSTQLLLAGDKEMFQKRMIETKTAQKSVGLQSTMLSSTDRAVLSNHFINIAKTNPTLAADELMKWRVTSGSNFHQMMAELSNAKAGQKLPAEMLFISSIPDRTEMASMITAVTNPKLDQEFNTRFSGKTDKNEIVEAVKASLQDELSAIGMAQGGTPGELGSGLMNATVKRAQMIALTKPDSESNILGTSADMAVKGAINNYWVTVSDKSGSLLIPKTSKNEADNEEMLETINNFTEESLTDSSLSTFEWVVPDSFRQRRAQLFGKESEEVLRLRFLQTRESRPRFGWANNESFSGAQLKVMDSEGGNWVDVLDKGGSPIVVPFSEMKDHAIFKHDAEQKARAVQKLMER